MRAPVDDGYYFFPTQAGSDGIVENFLDAASQTFVILKGLHYLVGAQAAIFPKCPRCALTCRLVWWDESGVSSFL